MLKHTFVYMLAFALPGLLGFFSFSVYTRLLTPAEYGVYSVGASMAFLIGNIGYGWIRFSIARFQAEAHDTNFVPFALTAFGVTTLVAAPLVVGGAILVLGEPSLVVAAVLAMAIAQALFEITQEMRRARHQSGAFARTTIGRSLLSFSLSVTLAYLYARGAMLLIGIAAGFGIMALSFFASQRQVSETHSGDRNHMEVGLIRRFLRYGMPLALSGLVFSGNSTLVRLLVGGVLGADAVGHFGAALDLTSQLSGILAGSVTSIMGPLAIGAYRRGGAEEAQRELRSGVVLFLGILMPAMAGLAVVSHPLAEVISGPAFETTVGTLLPLLALSRGLNVFAQYYLHLGFQLVEKPIRQVICGGATLVTNVVLNLVLTRYFGLMGAVWALVIADFVGVIVSFILLRPVFAMPVPGREIGLIAVNTAAMAVICILIQQAMGAASAVAHLTVTIAAGVLVYAGLGYLFDTGKVRSKNMIARGIDATLNRFR
jgi:O-antigen/teichoic acid export membrane protein